MYGRGAAAAATLPVTGAVLELGWFVVAGATLIALGLALMRLIPRDEA